MNKVAIPFFVVGLSCMPMLLVGQTPPTNAGHIRCMTYEWDQARRAANPKLGTTEDFENWMAKELSKPLSPGSQTKVTASRVIPTVVHVIYSNATENISTGMIQSQIDILNEDFQRLNPDAVNTPPAFVPAAANCDIEFCLAQIDPLGNATTGIDRVSMAGSPFSMATIDATIKPATIWDPNQYFNIWVCNMSGGLLGYAQFPEAASLAGIGTGNGAANTDGVAILYASVGRPPFNTFGGPYNLGRTATHEIGHWLGLRHIWGDGNCAATDYCADTPPSGGPNFGCPAGIATCGPVQMVQNYMDYTDDNCMNVFTQNQKSRMDVVLGSSIRRASLLSSSVCSLSPAISFFSATTTMTENSTSGTSGCRGYQDINIVLRIGGPPTGAATVTMTVVSQTLTAGVDYQVMTGAVVFPNGVTGNRNFVLRIFDDASVEAIENLVLGFTISGATNAYIGSIPQHTLTLNDNDLGPTLSGTTTLLNETFEAGGAGWVSQNGGGINQWLVAGTNGLMTGTRSCYVSRNATALQYTNTATSASALRSPLINATGYTGLTVSFQYKSVGESGYDYGVLAYSLNGTTYTAIAGTPTGPFVAVSANTNYTIALPTILDNSSFYLGWIWGNDNTLGTNPPFAIDNVTLTARAPLPVENTLSSTNTEYLGPFSTVYWYDNATGDVMLSVNNNTAWDYGCTSVTINRAGTGAVLYIDPVIAYALTTKTFLVTPANNNPTGSYKVRLYYRANEILGWETATGQLRANINVAKTGGPIANITPATPNANGPTNYYGTGTARGIYNGSDFYVEADFTTGFSGFGAGIQNPGSLPATFLDIEAQWDGLDAVVNWSNGELPSLKNFVVERRVDNGEFSAVASVPGSGENLNAGEYEYRDAQIGESSFSSLSYRIRTVDFDGNGLISEIVKLQASTLQEISIAPNPFDHDLQLRFGLAQSSKVSIQIFNGLGEQITSLEMSGKAGSNFLDLSDWVRGASGLYFIKVNAAGQTHILKALKQD
jgi:hypothetical protein